MAFQEALWRRLRYLTRRSRFQSELSDEMQFHVECRAAELEETGLTHEDALARARREFGSRVRAAEDTHSVWQFRWLEDLSSDLRYAARALRRNPAFALTAIFCLALGIGVNTTIFSITTSFLFSLPSCRDASSLIAIWEGGNSASSIVDFKFIRDSHIFQGMAGMDIEREVNWRDGDRTSRLYAGLVTDDYFGVLGVPFHLGRGIAPGETDTAVLSYRLWRGRFAGDASILGRKTVLDGRVHTIVGVLPADHRTIIGFGISPEIYVPAVHENDIVQFYARLPEGMLLAVLGAVVGLLIDVACARLVSSPILTLPLPIPIQLVVTPDWRLLLYCMLVAILSALISPDALAPSRSERRERRIEE